MLPQSKGRRSSTDIIADILGLLRLGEAGKTEIMYKTKMSHSQRQKYLENMMGLGLVGELRKENGSASYRVTRKGLRVLRTIENMQEALLREEALGVLGTPALSATAKRYKPNPSGRRKK